MIKFFNRYEGNDVDIIMFDSEDEVCEEELGHCYLRRVNRHIVYSCKLEVQNKGKGYAQLLDIEKVRVARAMLYSTMLCTVRDDNHAQRRAMQKVDPKWLTLWSIRPGITLYVRNLIED